jgi:hypothetical protein
VRAPLAGRKPPVSQHDRAVPPGLLVAHDAGELGWCRAGTWTHIRSAARPAPDQDATADQRPPCSTPARSQRPRSPAARIRRRQHGRRHQGPTFSTPPLACRPPPSSHPPTGSTEPPFPHCCHRPHASHQPSPTSGRTRIYTGSAVADAAAKPGVTVDIGSELKPGRGFIGQPRRSVVEPTNGSINHCPRPDRHYQTTREAHAGFPILSQITLPLRRLDRTQLFDTL